MFSSLIVLLSSWLIYNNNGPTYTVEKAIDNFEVRKYDSWIVAETVVKATRENAGSQAFHILVGYIFGGNAEHVKIEMTAPVTVQEVGEGEFLVQFFMPKEWTMNTLPKPNDPRVNLKQLPKRRFVVERYTGGWSNSLYHKELLKIEAEVSKEHMNTKGQPIWAGYNSPMTPSFLRTNEIMFELA